jgi:hypothetical protein
LNRPTDIGPISAPPFANVTGKIAQTYAEGLRVAQANIEAAREKSGEQSLLELKDEHLPQTGGSEATIKSEPTKVAPKMRLIMQITNRLSYLHYYEMPADVGLQNVPKLVQAMMEEGLKLTDIQITFEAKEIK